MKGNSVAICAAHKVPLNRCRCVVLIHEGNLTQLPAGAATPTQVSNFRERQERVNAQQWLNVADARDRVERMDVPRGSEDSDDDIRYDPGFPWGALVLGGIAIAIALCGLYLATEGKL